MDLPGSGSAQFRKYVHQTRKCDLEFIWEYLHRSNLKDRESCPTPSCCCWSAPKLYTSELGEAIPSRHVLTMCCRSDQNKVAVVDHTHVDLDTTALLSETVSRDYSTRSHAPTDWKWPKCLHKGIIHGDHKDFASIFEFRRVDIAGDVIL